MIKYARLLIPIFLIAGVLVGYPVRGEDFDPYLSAKAAAYEDWLRRWHTTGLGGVTDIYFTDETRQEILRTGGSGDSTDWTAFYLTTQAIRYIVTGEAEAREEVLRIAHYLHQVQEITDDPGYLARYAAPDAPPWNVEEYGSDRRYPGTGEYEGFFWLGDNVRDKYISWYWALTWAYDAVDDEQMRSVIREDFRSVTLTLMDNDWIIVDPWGDVFKAADILPDTRLEILLQTAHVTGDQYFWDLLDEEYERSKDGLWLTTFAGFNKYFEYFAFINNHPIANATFRLWPERRRLEYLFSVWNFSVRQFVKDTHNVFFDAVYYGACLRLNGCDPADLAAIEEDALHGLTVFWDPPNYQREVVCSELPLDPFSVWADEFLRDHPWLEELVDIDPQTAVAHDVDDRCWKSHLWECTPYHVSCTGRENPAKTAPGLDYLIGYWMGVYYGVLPGGGPYGDDDPTGPEDDDGHDDDDFPGDDDVPGWDDDAPPTGGDADSAAGCGC